MLKFLSKQSAAPKVHVSSSHWKPSCGRSHASNVFDQKHPIFKKENNQYEKFINCFARSKLPGSWTREECVSEGRNVWNAEIFVKKGLVNEQKMQCWVSRFPPSNTSNCKSVYRVREEKADIHLENHGLTVEDEDTSNLINQIMSQFLNSDFPKAVLNTNLNILLSHWEIDLQKAASVCYVEQVLQKVLENACPLKLLLKFENLAKQFDIQLQFMKKRNRETKLRADFEVHRKTLKDISIKLGGGIGGYYDSMKSSVTRSLVKEHLEAKMQLSEVVIDITTFSSIVNTRDEKRNSYLSSIQKRLKEVNRKVDLEPAISANILCTKSWEEVMCEIENSQPLQMSKLIDKQTLLYMGNMIQAVEIVTSSELCTLVRGARGVDFTVGNINSELPSIFPCMVVKRQGSVDLLFVSKDSLVLCGDTAFEKLVNFWDGEIEKVVDDTVEKVLKTQIPDISAEDLEAI